ncbi:MAG TPA: hypothetical protein ENG59_00385 [Chloroflexi bacterium]|nr:MAG: hypothetical protein DRI46_05955 [Chloroflexota bacterium]HDD54683.1 hypothetical protein [Chloroflexota bacterium]
MKIKQVMSTKAIVVVFFGLGFLFLTETIMSLYGMEVNSGAIVAGRLLGGMYTLIALLLWLCRNTQEASTKKAFAIAVTIGDAIGTVVSLLATQSGAMNSMGWSAVGIYLIFTLGFGYFILKPEEA